VGGHCGVAVLQINLRDLQVHRRLAHSLVFLLALLLAIDDRCSENPCKHKQLRMEPVVGLEPTTDGLQNRCSTTELNWLKLLKIKWVSPYFRCVSECLYAQFVFGIPFQLLNQTAITNRGAKQIWNGSKHRMSTSSVTNLAAIILGVFASMASLFVVRWTPKS
jgi:hypothetical protein